jgi:hypothetical protein
MTVLRSWDIFPVTEKRRSKRRMKQLRGRSNMQAGAASAFEINEPMVISETIDGETIIINLTSGTYYSLKHAGANIWAGIEQGASLGDIATLLRSRYESGAFDLEEEIASLVQKLVGEDLIRPARQASRLVVQAPSHETARAIFEPPLLEKFTDMEMMLLLDPVHDVDDEGWPHMPVEARQADV